MIQIFVISPTETTKVNLVNDDDERGIAEFINATVGGWFDAVHPYPSNDLNIVGYVNDEGLLMGLEPNIVASALFGRVLVGTAVVVGALDEEGQYDGNSHSVGQDAIDRLSWLCAAQSIMNTEGSCDHEYHSYCPKCGMDAPEA